MKNPVHEIEESMKLVDLHPTLEEVVSANGLDRKKLTIGLKMQDDHPDLSAREEVMVCDRTRSALWKVPSLRALFRGERLPPDMRDEPPPAYMPLFFFIELHIVTFCNGCGDKTDGEFEEAYSNLRRRPDGKSLSPLHFFLWQVSAGLLGRRAVSAAEFDAIFGRLTRSARTFRIGAVSRNYITVIRQMQEEMDRAKRLDR
ncbi:MAG: hypothetical protein FJ398_06925 [Verrucomicrobia bacterium]|nr:hypothetical protein [Verrucomicrobiota bacterium]